MSKHRVILLPGSVLPASIAYQALIDALGTAVDAAPKELEVYAADTPPPDYTLDHEVSGVLREADARDWQTFHLVGYSGGGATALAVTAHHPERLQSLALMEPAWAGNWDLSPEAVALAAKLDELKALPPSEFMPAFVRIALRSDVPPPPPPASDPPSWMAKRPAGIGAFITTFETYDLDRDALAAFTRPVYYALGALSNPDQYGEIATRLSRVFPDFTLEVYEQRHHFDPPHRTEPDRVAQSLLALWQRAEDSPRPYG
jgi:pimeloyl-ACP methyl ester carboxylesterase